MRIVMAIILVLFGMLAGGIATNLQFAQTMGPAEPSLIILLAAVSALMMFSAVGLILTRPRHPLVTTNDPDRMIVPLCASFTGLAGVPLLALAHNSLSPRLEIGSDRIVYGLGRRTRSYSEVERVDVMTLPGTRNLTFVWCNSPFSFTANVKDEASRLRALAALDDKGVRLTSAAQALLAASGTQKQSETTEMQQSCER